MKRLVKKLLHLFYPRFKNEEYFNSTLVKYILWQKVLGINRKASWPVHFTSQIKSPEKIQNGTKAPGYSMGCYIDARNGIIIEENVFIGPKVSLISMNHDKDDLDKYVDTTPIILHKNCWLATNVTILAGVELGEHTVVAAGAVVTKSFPEGNQMLAGNPAVVIKKL
ncbi:MAG: acyltransferase [Bacteroidales bacterium]|nr:acyltransferase [Bacteroidales bacterium]